ncbi:MAG: methyltransferase family protein [Candidatus Aminicenantales bacterium]
MDDPPVVNSEKIAANARLKKKILVRVVLALGLLGLAFFAEAGTWRYWEAWIYMTILFIPVCGVILYFLKNDPEVMVRRMRPKEREPVQKRIVSFAGILIVACILLPGFDRRFGWSAVPTTLVVAADVMILLGYAIFIRVIVENRYLSRIVEVTPDQKVVTTGPYAVIRHPMYVGTILIYFFTPLALGYWWALIPMALATGIFPLRIRNEESVLLRELAGYREYSQKVRFRLIPGIW